MQTNVPLGGAVNGIAVNGKNIFVCTDFGIFLSTDDGTSWSATSQANLGANAIVAEGEKLFVVRNGVSLSTDGGISWNAVNNGLPSYSVVFKIAISGTTLFAMVYGSMMMMGGWGIFRSTDDGAHWTAVGLGYLSVYTIAAYSNSAGDTDIFAGTDGGLNNGYLTPGVFLSTDDGISWDSLGLVNVNVRAIAAVHNGSGDSSIFAGTTNGIFRSTNGGLSWDTVNTGIPDTIVRALAVSPNGTGGNNLFAGTDSGVFLSTNNGDKWTSVNTGFTNTTCVMVFSVSGTYLFAGTNNGVWRRPLSEMITEVERLSAVLPMHFSLDQNYPNPFNPATIISFSLPSKSFVSLKVFDIIGKEVATIVSEEMSAGNHSRQWNAANISSGIYFCQMQAGSFVETKKLVLLK